ncbi:uncharacterized protein VTP21DRAFT_1341 [Calcarisporiella thermophila]|uniref:uncharacterized protein n=1 Tax=Calcarisporiella thermophila TaxID=911321 RepID=UPI0037438702
MEGGGSLAIPTGVPRKREDCYSFFPPFGLLFAGLEARGALSFPCPTSLGYKLLHDLACIEAENFSREKAGPRMKTRAASEIWGMGGTEKMIPENAHHYTLPSPGKHLFPPPNLSPFSSGPPTPDSEIESRIRRPFERLPSSPTQSSFENDSDLLPPLHRLDRLSLSSPTTSHVFMGRGYASERSMFEWRQLVPPPFWPLSWCEETSSIASAAVTMPARRKRSEDASRFADAQLEDFVGEIYPLCKDQQGCRFLQRKLEEKSRRACELVFNEVVDHFSELMTDPFGNYLCQKLLEHCTDEQRTVLVDRVAPDLVAISMNLHGTRAVQRMVECLSNPRQVHSVIVALERNVVTLIKNLNGNHVIQKCLKKMSLTESAFIYDTVARHCVEVATHRHGCCVFQRCVDHASEIQRAQLSHQVIANALALVMDPYGNYVVQYIIDLDCDEAGAGWVTEMMVRQFLGNMYRLSLQKFSSNVIEKCLRVSGPSLRRKMIEELLPYVGALLADSYGNYVVQTALDHADKEQRAKLVEMIRPRLAAIRNTPHGKRIQTKLQRHAIEDWQLSYDASFLKSDTSAVTVQELARPLGYYRYL